MKKLPREGANLACAECSHKQLHHFRGTCLGVDLEGEYGPCHCTKYQIMEQLPLPEPSSEELERQEKAELERFELWHLREEYPKLLNLCAKLAHAIDNALEDEDDDIWEAIEWIQDYVETNHPDWQG